MKTAYRLLGVCIVLLAMGTAAIWYLYNIPNSVVVVENTQREPVANRAEARQRKSPELGKSFPGLPEYCADKLISVSGCDGMTEITTDQGNTNRLVEIGDQCWFADNLKEIPSTDQGWYGFYNDAEEEPAPGEGMLYTWEAAMNGEIPGLTKASW